MYFGDNFLLALIPSALHLRGTLTLFMDCRWHLSWFFSPVMGVSSASLHIYLKTPGRAENKQAVCHLGSIVQCLSTLGRVADFSLVLLRW